MNRKGNKVIYKKQGNLVCYNAEDGGEKVLCAIDDDTRFENVLVRDRYVLIFEKDDSDDKYQAYAVDINDGTKTKIFETELPYLECASGRLITVTDREMENYEVYRIK